MSIDIMLPLEAFDPDKLKLEISKKLKCTQANVQRFIYSLQYKNDLFSLSPFSILTPFAKVHIWDFTTGKLEIDLGTRSTFQTKYTTFQSSIRSLVEQEYPTKPYFHPMLFGTVLTVYLFTKPENYKDRETWCYNNEWTDKWTNKITEHTFVKGQYVRLGIQFQGICFLHDLEKNDLKYRLQHQIKTIYCQTS